MNDLDFGSTIKGFAPGQKVCSRYLLQKILGRGGMGVVWLARDEELERDVALKFLPEVVSMDSEALRDLKRETRRSLELTHPHIIRIYDFVQDGRTAAISMEYVAGHTLAQRKLDQPEHCFTPAELLPWVEQLAMALDHAHRKAQVVHRDLKPANLMLDAHGDLKIADFGIAASVSDSVSRVSAQAGSSGTPVYMSPQQMMGEKPAVTDDIYAIGATLYDLLTGKPPFYSGNVIAQVQTRVPPSLADRRLELGIGRGGAIPAGWEQTIAACLAKDPKARPQTARDLAARLRGEGATEPPATGVQSIAAAPASSRASQPSAAAVPIQPKPSAQAEALPRIPDLRRWLGAPLLASVPATLAFMTGALAYEASNGRADMEAAVAITVLAAMATVAQYLFFLVVLAIRRPWTVRSPLGISVVGALLGGLIGGLALTGDAGDTLIVPSVFMGMIAGALQGWLLHRMAVGYFPGDPAGEPARRRNEIFGAVAAMLAVLYFYGIHYPSRVEAHEAQLASVRAEQQRLADEAALIAAEQERLRLEAEAERERLRQEAASQRQALEQQRLLDQRRLQVGPVIAEAYRVVFDRAPTATELEIRTGQLLQDPQRDGAWLRRDLRGGEEGRKGGRLLVPQEFKTIGEAITAAVPGNAIHVGPGTYREAVYLGKNVSLIGAGRDRVTVEAEASNCALLTGSVSGVVVSGFTFRHTSTNEETSRASVVGLSDSSLTFTQNTMVNSNGNAMHLKGAGRNIITGNIFRDSRWAGLAMYAGTAAEISRNEFVDNQQTGIAIYELTAGVVIADNTIRGNKHNGMWLADGNNVTVQNNTITNNGTTGQNYGGFGVGKGSPRLRGNISRDNIGPGIWFHADATARIEAGNMSDGQPLTVTP